MCVIYHELYDRNEATELLKLTKAIQVDIHYKDNHYKPFLLYVKTIYVDLHNTYTHVKENTISANSNEAQK